MVIKMANLLFKAYPGLDVCGCITGWGKKAKKAVEEEKPDSGSNSSFPLSTLTDADRPIKLSGAAFAQKYMDVCAQSANRLRHLP